MKRGDRVSVDDVDGGRKYYTVLRTYSNSKNTLNVFLAFGVLSIDECTNHPDWDYIWSGNDKAVLTKLTAAD